MTWRTAGLKQSIWDAESNALKSQRINMHDRVDVRRMQVMDAVVLLYATPTSP